MINSMQILFSFIIVIIAWILYSRRWSHKILVDFIIGRYYYRKRKQSEKTYNLLSSTTESKEITIFILSLLFSIFVIVICNSTCYRNLVLTGLDSIVKFTKEYSLTVSILGAFCALWGIYFIVHLKFFISPIVSYSCPANQSTKTFMWYICNRSIFDAVNINIAIFKCKRTSYGILYEDLKLTCPKIAYLTGRLFPKSNKVIVKIRPNQIKIDDIVKHNFDFLEINVTAVHALSNVISVWTTQYNIEDIYYAKVGKDVVVSDRQRLNELPVVIDTLRTNMCKRFMIARKYVAYATLFLSILLAFNLGFMHTTVPEWLGVLNHGAQNGLACVIILFSTMRYLMQLPIVSTLADYKYKLYKVETK